MRRILATSIAAAIPAVLPVSAVDAFTKPAPPSASGSHSRPAPRTHNHTGHATHGRSTSAPEGETHNRPGRGPENDVKVDADDGGGPGGEAQGAPEGNAPEHGASQARSPRKATRNHPSRPARGNPVSRPGTGADSGFADADDSALPPEAAAAVKEADELQHTAQQADGPRDSAPNTTPDTAPNTNAPQGAAPAEAPGAAPAAPKGTGRGRPANQMTDQSTNQTGSRKAGRTKTPRSMPVAFFSGPVTRGSHLVLHMSAGTSPQHTVTLQCEPAGGTHPKAAEACADVAKAGGDLAQMPANTNPRACFMIYQPVTVTAQGEWKGQPVRYTKKFPNTCVMRDKTGSVFDF
jgi:hypothetical protein